MMRLPALAVIAWMPLGCVGTQGVSKVDADLYRSGQLSRSQLEQCVPMYGIRTVISLRDRTPEYEIGFCTDTGTNYFSVPLHKHGTMEQLRDIFRIAEKPILVHCFWGKDRTGAAVDEWVRHRSRW